MEWYYAPLLLAAVALIVATWFSLGWSARPRRSRYTTIAQDPPPPAQPAGVVLPAPHRPAWDTQQRWIATLLGIGAAALLVLVAWNWTVYGFIPASPAKGAAPFFSQPWPALWQQLQSHAVHDPLTGALVFLLFLSVAGALIALLLRSGIVSGGKEEFAILMALFFLEYAITFGLGVPGWEYRLMVYVPGVIILSLVLKWVPKERRKTALAMMIIAFAIFGFSHFSWERLKSLWIFGGGSQQTATAACPGTKRAVEFGSIPQRINPNASCAPDVWHDGGCLYVQRARWTNDAKIYGPHCFGILPNDVEWAWSAGMPFRGAVALQPPRYQ